jgi:hypothetical protein
MIVSTVIEVKGVYADVRLNTKTLHASVQAVPATATMSCEEVERILNSRWYLPAREDAAENQAVGVATLTSL